MIDKKIIAERKAMYGDNFKCIAEVWSDCLIFEKKTTDFQPSLDERTVALMMANMKQCRIDAIDKKLAEFPIPEVGIKLHKAREDSVIDKANYEWIAHNFAEYKAL